MKTGVLQFLELATLPLALKRRVVRAASESLGLSIEFRHVEEILGLCAGEQGSEKSLALPHRWMVSRTQRELRFEPGVTPKECDYEYRLPVPGSVEVVETQSRFEAMLLARRAAKEYNPEHLLDRSALCKELIVRNWRAGDRFWPPHTKAPKKIKELLQARHVTGSERKRWPVMVNGAEVVWVRGFATPSRLRPRGTEQVVMVREAPAKLSGDDAESSPHEADWK